MQLALDSPRYPQTNKAGRNSTILLDSKPVKLREFTTDISATESPGDPSLWRGLLFGMSQTTNTIVWQDDDSIRRVLAALTSIIDMQPAPSLVNEEAAKANLFEIRRLTGFSWDEIGSMVGVDRRTLHNWSQGGLVRETNRRRLAELLRVLRFMDRGTAEANRIALANPGTTGVTGLSLLRQSRFAEARIALGKGGMRAVLPAGEADRLYTLRHGAVGLGYFSDEQGSADDSESFEAPAQPEKSRRVPVKRD